MASMIDWLQNDTAGLLTLAAASIAVLLLAIIKFKIEPFIALFVVAILVALVAGLPVNDLVGTPTTASKSLLETGFAGILGHITLIIGLGTVLGAIMERSGGADVLTTRLLKLFGPKGAPLAMGLTGLILGIPVFFDIGIFVLAPLVYVAAKRGGRSLVLYAMPMLAGLSVTHAFLPPHPGPVAAAGLFGVGLGWIIIMGLICGIPAWLVAGVWWGSFIGKRVHVEVPDEFLTGEVEGPQGGTGARRDGDLPGGPGSGGSSAAGGTGGQTVLTESPTSLADRPGPTTAPPSLGLVSLVIAVPMLLILAATMGSVALADGSAVQQVAFFLGTPAIALGIAVLLALWLLGTRRGMTTADLGKVTGESLKPIGMILLVVGAGAFYGAVLRATGIGDAVAGSMQAGGLPVILSAYLISCALRLAQGSATVAIVTTAGIVQPLVTEGGFSQPQIALLVIAISAGSIIASHVNDGGFWIVAKYFNMSVKDTLKTWTVLETILSVVGFAMAGLVWLFL
ncbi:GntP family permease [Modestobacter sp. SSW1-42]|uniref:GntP family permease n=1 Tax=Modestobacter sp. SSW1-42 TaxID=596372 RepID=UPI0039858DE3